MTTKTIDVNIPASAIEELAEAVTNHLDLDSAIDNSDLAGRLSELENKVDDIDTSECVSDGDFRDLERTVEELESDISDKANREDLDELMSRVDALENKTVNNDGEPIVHRIERLEETNSQFVTVSDRLDRIEADINARVDGLNARIRYLEERVNKFDQVFASINAAIKLNLF